MKQTNINIDEIKRFPTVTNPILADDLHTPQAYAFTLRRAIVTDCNDRQRAELVELLEGKESAEGVTFNNTKANRDRLHIWQNSENRKERAAILGEGWQWIEGLNHGTQPGDVITCIDGTRGRVTKASGESCVIEFETEDGHRLSVAGYFRYTPSAKSETDAEKAFREALTINVGDRVERIGTGATGTIDDVNTYEGQLTFIVKYDETQRRHSDGFEYLTEEVFENEIEPASEIKAIDVLQVGTMVRMPGVIGGLRVEEIDRKGDRVICVDGCKERHTYKGLDYFTTTAEEIRIPEWLRICQYFEMDESFGHTRVLCTDIEPCCDALWPVLIRWEDGEDKGGIHLTSALDALNCKAYYYSEYQKLGHQEARPQEWLKKTTNEKRATYYRTCVELERMAGDGLPLVIRADGADTEANPWNALEKRVKTARVFHLGDRVKMHYPYQCNEVTGVINRIRFDEGSLSLGGWCTHYDIRFDEEYQRPNNFGGKDVGVGVISPERIELVERAEFCHEPASEWLQPGEKVAHYLDYGDGTDDWLIGNVTGYELCDDGTVIVIYGEYRTPLKGMVKYQPEMDGKAA